jgi:hypothetical protein
VGWVGDRLRDLPGLLEGAGVAQDEVGECDADELTEAVPEILAAVERLLVRIRRQPRDHRFDSAAPERVRTGWL